MEFPMSFWYPAQKAEVVGRKLPASKFGVWVCYLGRSGERTPFIRLIFILRRLLRGETLPIPPQNQQFVGFELKTSGQCGSVDEFLPR